MAKHDYTKSKNHLGFGPRFPAMEPSKANQRRIVHWTATDAAKAIPNTHARGNFRKGERNEQTKHEFWNACAEEDTVIVKQFAEVFDATWEEPK